MTDALLSVRDLKVHFPLARGLLGRSAGSVKAVDGVSLELRAGETLGIVGESGCGKSTLGRAILRLIKATSGNIVWLGRDLNDLDAGALRKERRNMQIIFQDPLASLDPRMTVGQIIARPLKTFEPGLGRAETERRVMAAMQEVGLAPEMVRRYPHEFSGGQCQRIGIARAMILRPKLVVCDEPVSALDVSIQARSSTCCAACRRRTTLRCCSSRTTSASCGTSATACSCSISAGSWRWPTATPSSRGRCIPIRRP
jgi:oligopeptide transport system ATP-binding protein